MLKPNHIFKNITDITAEFLASNGIKSLLLDVDNTLAVYGTKEPVHGIIDWIETMQNAGVSLKILSNARKKRISIFAAKLNLPYYALSFKPLPFRIRSGVKKMGYKKSETAMIGDQIFTDILGANLSGIISILVKPIQFETGFSYKFKRWLERKMLKKDSEIWE